MVRVRSPKEILQKLQDENINITEHLSFRERASMYDNNPLTNIRVLKIVSLYRDKGLDIDDLFFHISTYVKIPMVV